MRGRDGASKEAWLAKLLRDEERRRELEEADIAAAKSQDFFTVRYLYPIEGGEPQFYLHQDNGYTLDGQFAFYISGDQVYWADGRSAFYIADDCFCDQRAPRFYLTPAERKIAFIFGDDIANKYERSKRAK